MSNLRHAPIFKQNLVQTAGRSKRESMVEQIERNARGEEAAHEVVVVHVYLLLGLFASILWGAPCEAIAWHMLLLRLVNSWLVRLVRRVRLVSC